MTEDACCKLGRNVERYGLDALDEELVAQRNEESTSLRALADHVNSKILEHRLDSANVDILANPTSIYEVLTSSDEPAQRVVEVTDHFEEAGIDVDELRDDFVSYQTVRRHLNQCLGVRTERQGVDTTAEGREVATWALEHCENVTERTIARLRRTGGLSIGRTTVEISVTVSCQDCGGLYSLDELWEREGCECE